MNRAILYLSFRETAFWIPPLLCFLFGWIVFVQEPLRYYDAMLALFAVLLGGVTAFRIFRDKPVLRPFLFSRAFSPCRLFTVRWLFGMGILTGTWLVAAILIGSGVRQQIQVSCFQNGWFPMMRFKELECLIGFVTISLLVFQTTTFLVTLHAFESRLRFKGWQNTGRVLLLLLFSVCVALGVVLLGVVLIASGFSASFGDDVQPFPLSRAAIRQALLLLTLPGVLQTLLVPLAGRYCYRNMEIES